MNAQELTVRGLAQHQTGKLAEAETLYRQALQITPTFADALHLLGVCEHQLGRNAEAIDHIQAAIRFNPSEAGYYSNLGSVFAAMNRFEDAVNALSTAVRLDSNSPQAQNNLGNALRELNRPREAEAAYRRAINVAPSYPEPHYHLAGVLAGIGRFDDAAAMYQRAIQLRPDYAGAMNNYAMLLKTVSRLSEAILWFEHAIAIKPDYLEAINNLANTWQESGDRSKAIPLFRRALAIRADADVLNNLAAALREEGQLDEAETAASEALKIRPQFAQALATLAGIHKDAGRMDEAMALFAQSYTVKPSPNLPGNELFNLHHLDGIDAKTLITAHAQWNDRYAKHLAPACVPTARHSHRTRLRVGYVSPDFGHHPVGRFMLPLLQNHDHARFEIFCYADVRNEDAVTKKLERSADTWRMTLGATDADLAELIRRDEIDILIDLAMHTRHSRIMMFALKPAPAQVTYLGYPSTTGLATIDYRVSDPYIDPPGQEPGYCEKTIRLPRTYWCFAAPDGAPDVGPLPSDRNGFITFGCMNQYTKVTPPMRGIWRQILRQLPNARLIVHAPHGRHRAEATRELQQDGLDPNRLQFVAAAPYHEYLARFNQIDIGLDTYPYPGGTTTCEALWMGVSVVTRPGELSITRGGLSVLSNVGLAELAARDVDDYANIAVGLATDPDRLRSLRVGMRQRMIASPLMDAPRFAHDFETLLESIAPGQ